MRLNKSFTDEITDGFGDTRFSAKDFSFTYPTSGRILLTIQFKHQDGFSLKLTKEEEYDVVTQRDGLSALMGGASERKSKYTVYYIEMTPGEYEKTDKIEISSLGDTGRYIRDWCSHIYSEMSSMLVDHTVFDDLREQMEASFDETIEKPEESFSNEEVEAIKVKFDDLLKKFEELQEKNEITKSELGQIRQDLDNMKSSATVMPKGLWARVTNNKLVDIAVSIAKSKEGRTFLIEEIKKLLPGG